MARCTILYTGLLGPEVPLQDLPAAEWPDKADLPNLSLLLNRGKEHGRNKTSLEQQILSSLGYRVSARGELPVAALRQQLDTMPDASCWCLDPVYVQLDREMAYLAASDELKLSAQEARELIGTLNRHFGNELQIEYLAPQQWLLPRQLKLHTYPPSEAMFQDIRRFQPTGADAAHWQSILNEVQMLLHAHPVNEARIHAQLPPVNSLWLWGGGEMNVEKSDFDLVCTENTLAITAAARNRLAHAPLPGNIDATLFFEQNVLLIDTAQLQSQQQRDVHTWFAALRQLDQTILAPLVSCLRTGALDELQLLSDTVCFNCTKKILNRWWRRQAPLSRRMLELRQHYGH